MAHREYSGYLREYVPQIVTLHEQGLEPLEIVREIRKLGARHHGGETEDYYSVYDWTEATCCASMEQTVRYVLRRMLLVKIDPYPPRAWHEAARTHAMFLRLEGCGYLEIGNRLGVTREQARMKVWKANREWRNAMRRARFRWVQEKRWSA